MSWYITQDFGYFMDLLLSNSITYETQLSRPLRYFHTIGSRDRLMKLTTIFNRLMLPTVPPKAEIRFYLRYCLVRGEAFVANTYLRTFSCVSQNSLFMS